MTLSESTHLGAPVVVDVGGVDLHGDLTVPPRARGVVLFAHGSGSSRHSPRNRFIASLLTKMSLATLLIDLLTEEEEEAERYTGHLRFDIRLLARRLASATNWLAHTSQTARLSIGCFGASTGAGAALVAAAHLPGQIKAVVTRGGRPDLAGDALLAVRAPTLLIVGGHDEQVIDLNEEALAQLGSEQKKLVLVPGATHLFEEPGTLEEVARLAADWFGRYLNGKGARG